MLDCLNVREELLVQGDSCPEKEETWPRVYSSSAAEPGLKPRLPMPRWGKWLDRAAAAYLTEVTFHEAAQPSITFSWLSPVPAVGTGKSLQLLYASFLNRRSKELTLRKPFVDAGHVISAQCMSHLFIII